MKFSLTRDELLKPLAWVSSVVDKRQSMAVLQNILLVVEDNVLRLTGTDTELELVASINLVHEAQEGEITVPGRKLVDWLKQLTGNPIVDVRLDDQKLYFKAGRSQSRIATLPASDFPNLQDSMGHFSFKLERQALKKLIDKVSFAMAQQDVRYFLNGMLMDLKPGLLRLVATDGHRLALCQSDVDYDGTRQQAIVPRKSILELSRLLGEDGGPAEVILGQHHLRISLGSIIFTTKLIDGKFPEYERVLPRDGDKMVLAGRDELRGALLRTLVFCNEKVHGIRVTLTSGNLQLTASNAEQEEAQENISVEYSGSELEIGFNVVYLLDVLNVLDEPTSLITLGGQNSSLLLQEQEGRDASYVVMPMRI